MRLKRQATNSPDQHNGFGLVVLRDAGAGRWMSPRLLGVQVLTTVRYQVNGNNQLLRHVLCEVWGQQCYWRRHMVQYNDLQIDHVLPRTSNGSARDRLKTAFKMTDDFDVNALYNLAPICGTCNREKSDSDLTDYPVVLSTLKKAKKLGPKIASRVEAFNKPSKLGEVLLHAAEADLTDTSIRATFEEIAPAIVQKLADLGEGSADFFVFKTVDVEVDDALHSIGLKLNERGRAAVAVFESVSGGRLEDALRDPLSDLLYRAAAAAGNEFEMHNDGMGSPTVGKVEVSWSQVTIDTVGYESSPPAQLAFEFLGECEAVVTASVARDNSLDGELESVQGDAVVSGRFIFALAWEPSDPIGQFFFDQVWLDNWDADSVSVQ